MSLNVGELVGYLRLDMGDFESGMAKGQALADKLDGKDINVNVDANTGTAEAKLAAVAMSARKLADASAQVNIAQLRLNEAQSSGTTKASSLASAHQSLTKAERDLNDLMKASTPEVIRAADAMKQVDDSNKKVTKSSNDAGKGMGAMVAAVLLLGPALAPLLAGAAGLAVGFGAMGAAGILAVVGISQQMKAGTPLGLAYTGMLTTLKGDLTTLGQTAASGTLAPFQQAVADLQTRMPVLNSIIGEFSGITGRTAGVLVSGLVAAFISLAPLARDAGVYILTLTQRFAAAMSGPGVVSFGDYVRSVFPQVMADFESIVGAVFHLVAAIAPLGMGTLGILRVFADLINAMPVEHLAVLVQLASSVYIGFMAFKVLSGPLTGLSTALKFVGVSAESAAVGVRALTIAAGVIGAIITVATLLYSANADATRQNTQAANDYADALRTSNGILDENIRQMAFKNLSDSGAIAAARQLGISLSLVVDAALMQGDAMAKVTAIAMPMIDAFNKAQMSTGTSTAAFAKNGQAAGDLMKALGGQNTELRAGTQTWKDQTAATAASTGALAPAIAAQDALAAKVGTTGAALVLATAGQKTTADAAAQAAAKMYLENDAAGILKNTLDLLNGKTINAAQAQNSFDSSLVNMGDHVSATGTKITFTTKSIGDMSSASVALRGQLNGQVTNLQAVVEANGGLANSTGKAREQMVTMRQQIIDNAVAHGVDRAAVTAYIDKLLAIPKTVPPTKLDVAKTEAEKKIADLQAKIDAIKQGKVPETNMGTQNALAKIAALQRQIDALHGKNVVVNVQTHSYATGPGGSGGPVAGAAGGGLIGRYLGGLIGRAGGGGLLVGPGTPTSDSITGVDASGTPIVRVSRDEFVVNAAAYAKNKALVNAINDGTQGFAGGGAVGRGGAAFHVASMTVIGYDPDEAVRKFGREVQWQMAGT